MRYLTYVSLIVALGFISLGWTLTQQVEADEPLPVPKPNASSVPAAPQPDMNVAPNNTVTPAPIVAEEEKWRFKWHNDQWWYWLPNERWVIWQENRWQEYDPATYRVPASANSKQTSQSTSVITQSSSPMIVHESPTYNQSMTTQPVYHQHPHVQPAYAQPRVVVQPVYVNPGYGYRPASSGSSVRIGVGVGSPGYYPGGYGPGGFGPSGFGPGYGGSRSSSGISIGFGL